MNAVVFSFYTVKVLPVRNLSDAHVVEKRGYVETTTAFETPQLVYHTVQSDECKCPFSHVSFADRQHFSSSGAVECHFSEPTGGRRCFGEEGQPLLFHLKNSADTDIRLIKDSKHLILRAINNQIVKLNDEYVNQPELFTGGTINQRDTLEITSCKNFELMVLY
ncbi:Hypothetical protein SMAX5B_019408 [Scophthalmus maximus]|uniref:FHA domain-containing protein n=1 Tax=Scophthalmus maximus TaxID=52904 RepID=A0A2U9B7Q9_SCOMX|nr:Hypothetical protein SMAX5B_019408 [Scophthalmus maximus]